MVVVVLIETTHLSYFKAFHLLRSESPTHPKPVTNLLHGLIATNLVPFQLELGLLTSMTREFGLAFEAWFPSLLGLWFVSPSFCQFFSKKVR